MPTLAESTIGRRGAVRRYGIQTSTYGQRDPVHTLEEEKSSFTKALKEIGMEYVTSATLLPIRFISIGGGSFDQRNHWRQELGN